MAAATEQGGAEGVKMKTDVRNNPATGPDHYLKRANAPWWIKPPKTGRKGKRKEKEIIIFYLYKRHH